MKNTAIGNFECVTIISSEVRTNAGDPARAGNAAMNKAEAVNVNEPTADSKEVKTYIEDLLNKKRIIHLKSSYSSPVVLVRMVLCGLL